MDEYKLAENVDISDTNGVLNMVKCILNHINVISNGCLIEELDHVSTEKMSPCAMLEALLPWSLFIAWRK